MVRIASWCSSFIANCNSSNVIRKQSKMAIQYFGLMTMWNSQRSLDSCPLFLLLLGHCDCKCRTRTFSKLDFYQNDGIAEFQKQSSSSKSSVARQNSYAEAVNSWVLKGTIHDQFKVEYEAKCMKHCVECTNHMDIKNQSISRICGEKEWKWT